MSHPTTLARRAERAGSSRPPRLAAARLANERRAMQRRAEARARRATSVRIAAKSVSRAKWPTSRLIHALQRRARSAPRRGIAAKTACSRLACGAGGAARLNRAQQSACRFALFPWLRCSSPSSGYGASVARSESSHDPAESAVCPSVVLQSDVCLSQSWRPELGCRIDRALSGWSRTSCFRKTLSSKAIEAPSVACRVEVCAPHWLE